MRVSRQLLESIMATSVNEVADLLAAIALGDRGSFSRLYRRTSAKLFGLTLGIMRSRPEAEEALQETYVKIWRSAGRYLPGTSSPITWLAAIARNQCIDMIRRRPPYASELQDAGEVEDSGMSPLQLCERGDTTSRIDLLVTQLDDKKQILVRAAYFEGASYSEMASRYGLPLNTVRTRLKRGLRELRQMALDTGLALPQQPLKLGSSAFNPAA
jgi:RNA polymerase sigma-70 factor, ECF subfamily